MQFRSNMRRKLYLMYVDESGDCGLSDSPTRYYVLTGLIIHELRWLTYLNELIAFRRKLNQQYGLKLREEFHAFNMISNPGNLIRIKRHDRLKIVRTFVNFIAGLTDINLINVVVDKDGKPLDYDVFSAAWRALIQRFENTISNRNFPGPVNPEERGLIVPDNTSNKKLIRLLRKMRRYNPVPNNEDITAGYRNLPLVYIIEDPYFKDSRDSFFIQIFDLAAYILFQHLNPNAYMKKKGGRNFFQKLIPILCTVASRENEYGIVWL